MTEKPKIGFIGQGFVGKNYADYFESKGFETIRYSLEKPHIQNKDRIAECDIVFIGVPTPTTSKGFSAGIVESSINLVGKGKIAVIKSTILPGTTKQLQKKYPKQIVLYSPEFLSESTAAFDVAHPFSNIVGMPKDTSKHRAAAKLVNRIAPKAPHELICSSEEAEIIKYSHNGSGYTQIVFFNLMYDLSQKLGAKWENISKAIHADPLISNRYSNPLHKSGRGAGNHCFIKDFAALRELYNEKVKDKKGVSLMRAMESKNTELLLQSKKDLDLLVGVYGKKVLNKTK